MIKKNNNKIIWIFVALIIGILLGFLINGTIQTTGKAKETIYSKAETNLTESMQNLTLNLLKVNRIESNQRGLQISSIGTNGQIYMDSTNNLSLISGERFEVESQNTSINSFENINIKSGNQIKLYNTEDDGITINDSGINIKTKNFTVGRDFRYFQVAEVTYASVPGQPNLVQTEILMNAPTKYTTLSAGADTNYTGNAYACLTEDGTLYRSQSPCN